VFLAGIHGGINPGKKRGIARFIGERPQGTLRLLSVRVLLADGW
jgi:hypothetical protein